MTTRPLGFIAFAAATLCAGSALAHSRPQTPAPRTGVATQQPVVGTVPADQGQRQTRGTETGATDLTQGSGRVAAPSQGPRTAWGSTARDPNGPTQPRFEYTRIEGRNTLQACRARQGEVVPYQGVQQCRIPAHEAPAMGNTEGAVDATGGTALNGAVSHPMGAGSIGGLAAGTADQPGSTPAATRQITVNDTVPAAQFQRSRQARAGSATPPERAE